MSPISEILERIRATPDCRVEPPDGFPELFPGDVLPKDVREFYSLCGGLTLYESATYQPLTIVQAQECVPANPMLVGALYEDDISSHWYLMARDFYNDYMTIDFSEERAGRCYDSYHEIHGIRGSCPVIAKSFTEFLKRIYENRGERWYWLEPTFTSLGDAYDEV